jgi:glycosyltransferase involved in cell wall biosynthesis
MNDPEFDVSVIISTYNRCAVLPGALECVLAQKSDGVRYEVIVVDNNSTDETRQVVESFIERGYAHLRYVFEGKQGVSYGRNTGIEIARAPILAFTDDDVCVSRNWVATIKRAFDEHPEIDYLGGKVLPHWQVEMPIWLPREHWAPLAILDYGDEPFYANASKRLCLVGANLSFRRKVFEQIGYFAPDLQRVKDSIGSMEDLEMQVRAWRADRQGLYLPHLVVTAEVPPNRLLKAYHRKWHTGHGHFYAIMRLEELERSNKRPLFGVPAHLYRQLFLDCLAWLKHSFLGRRDDAFVHETRVRFFAGFFRKRRQDFLASHKGGTVGELVSFLRSLRSRKPHPDAHGEAS